MVVDMVVVVFWRVGDCESLLSLLTLSQSRGPKEGPKGGCVLLGRRRSCLWRWTL